MRHDQEQPAPPPRAAYLTALLARFDTVTLPLGPIEQGMPLRAVFQPLRLRCEPLAAGDPDVASSHEAGDLPDSARHQKPREEHPPEPEVLVASGVEALAASPTRRLVILGGPGTGKTTTLKQLLCAAAQDALADEHAPLPVFVSLPDLARAGASLTTYLPSQLRELDVPPAFAESISVAVAAGQAFLCLDSLDEVAPARRPAIISFLNDEAPRCGGTWIVGSRYTDYKGGQLSAGSFTEWELQPLTPAVRMELARRLLPALGRLEHGVDGHARGPHLSPTGFLSALEAHPQAASWGDNPLLFSLAAAVYVEAGALPRSRAALYAIVIDAALRVREPDTERRRELRHILGTLALRLHQTKGRTFTRQEMAAILAALRGEVGGAWDDEAMVQRILGCGLLDVPAHETYGFQHQTFQEYLAAEVLAAGLTSADAARRQDTWELAWGKRTYTRWTEVLRLMVGVLTHEHGAPGKEAARRWLSALVEQRNTSDGDPGDLGLALAIKSLAELTDETALGELASDVARQWVEDIIHAIRHPGWARMRRLMQQGNDVARFPSSVRMEAVDHLVRLLGGRREITLRVMEALVPFAESMPVEPIVSAFCRHRHHFDSTSVTLLSLLEKLRSPALVQAFRDLVQSADPEQRVAGADALGAFSDVASADQLVESLYDSSLDVRAAAVKALARLGDIRMLPVAQELLLLPTSENYYPVRRAIEALGVLGEPALPLLLNALRDQESLRAEVIRALGELGKLAPLDMMLGLLRDQDMHVRGSAVQALIQLSAQVPIPVQPLIVALDDHDDQIRRSALYVLGRVTRDIPVEHVLDMLRDPFPPIRFDALRLLAHMDGPISLDPIRAALTDEAVWVRAQAAGTLAHFGALDADAIARLVYVPPASLPDEQLRASAASLLRALGPRAPMDVLVSLLSDSSSGVRQQGVLALSNLPDAAPIEPLLAVLDDPEGLIRQEVGKVLATMGARVPADALLQRLVASSGHPDAALVFALGALGPRPPREVITAVLWALALGETAQSAPYRRGDNVPNSGVASRIAALRRYVRGDNGGDWPGQQSYAALCSVERWASDIIVSSGVLPLLLNHPGRNKDESVADGIGRILARIAPLLPFDQLVTQLHDESPSERAEAARFLGLTQTERAIVPLSDALHDADRFVRCVATSALGHIGGQKARDLLVDALESSDAYIRSAAIRGLAAMEADAPVERIRAALHDTDDEVRDTALRALVELRAELSSEEVATTLLNVPEWVRSELVRLLPDLGERMPDDIIDLLVQLLQRQGPFASVEQDTELAEDYDRWAAIDALGQLGERAPVEPLVEVLDDESFQLRAAAMRALGRLGRKAPIDVIVAGLGSDDFQVREAAVWTLRYVGNRAPIKRLQAILDDDWPGVRAAVRETLALIAPEALEELLPAALRHLRGEPIATHLDPRQQEALARMLGLSGVAAPVVLTKLSELLNWHYWEVRVEACKALGKLRRNIPDEAIRKLLELRHDPESSAVRAAADDALAEILSLETGIEDD